MPLPPSFLEELRARLTLSSVVGRKIRLTRAGREFKGCCPFHQEKTPSFYVNDDKQFFHCFGCGAHGDVIGFTMRHDNLSFADAIESLAAEAGLQVPVASPAARETYDREKRLYHLLDCAATWFEDQLRAPHGRSAVAYLRGRGLEDDALRRFRLGFAPDDGQSLIKAMTAQGFTLPDMESVGLVKKNAERGQYFGFFRGRVMFPVGDRRGRIVAFGGRVMDGGEPKYLNSPDHALFHKGRLLYGLSRARGAVTTGHDLIVAEGYMDVIALAEAGFHGAVAPLGTALTPEQLMLLWKLLPPSSARDPARDYSPVLCFDGDNAGIKAAARGVDRALPLLSAGQTVRVAYLPAGEDPDSLIRSKGPSAFRAVLDQARPMVDVLWDLATEGRRLATPEDQAALIAVLNEKIQQIADSGLRTLYQDAMRKKLTASFGWQDRAAAPSRRLDPSATGGRGKWQAEGRTSWQARPPAPRTTVRKQPPKARETMEKILIALLVNYPPLIHEHGEEISQITFSTPDLDAVRQEIMTFFALDTDETLDAAELYRHLSEGEVGSRMRAGLAAALSEGTYMHAHFARPGSDINQARQGWGSVWRAHLRETLQADLDAANRRCAAEPSDENWARLMALRAQLTAMTDEPADPRADFMTAAAHKGT